MILALDIGNTNITIGVFLGDELHFVSRMATDQSRMEDQYAIEIRDILTIYGVNPDNIDGAIISSVVPRLSEYIGNAVFKLFGVKPFFVSLDNSVGLGVKLDRPETIGGDLIAGCVAAKAKYSYPCIIIDMGTATTVVVVDKDGAMCGGAIIPGIGVSLDALVSHAALLSSVSLETPPSVIGKGTTECIQSGVIFGTAAMLDGICDRIEQELGYECRVIATGGLSATVIKSCKRHIEWSDTLLLEGLKIIYDNKKGE